jgi:hypothetical protein
MRRFFVSCALALALAMPLTPGVGNESAPKAFGQGSWQDLTGAH